MTRGQELLTRRGICYGLAAMGLLAVIALSAVNALAQQGPGAAREQEGITATTPLEREQTEAQNEVSLEKKLPEKRSFWSYAWRVMASPVMVLINYPRDEEREVSQTYYEYVNKGTSRHWRGQEEKDIKPGRDLKYEPETGGNAEKEDHASNVPHEADETPAL